MTSAWRLVSNRTDQRVRLFLGIGVNGRLSIAVLTGLPRLRMPLRRVLGPALLVAASLELLKTLGRALRAAYRGQPHLPGGRRRRRTSWPATS